MTDTQDQLMDQIHQEIQEFIATKLEQDVPAMTLAASMVVNALRIYRTQLNDEDFETLMDRISDQRSNVQPFWEPQVLQ